MSMLAERKRKQKWSLNPRGKAWSEDGNKFGQKLLEKMGWQTGKGLGAKEDGITEHVKVSYKNDSKGMGFKETEQWTEHESNFTALLESLTGTAADTNIEDLKLKSLEKKSRVSRVRLHYHKFTKGKDLSSRSEKDLANIFGKKTLKKVEKKVEEDVPEKEDETKTNGMLINSGSMADYFKTKLPAFGKPSKKAESESEDDVRVGFGFRIPSEGKSSIKRKLQVDDTTNAFSPRKKVKNGDNGYFKNKLPAFGKLSKKAESESEDDVRVGFGFKTPSEGKSNIKRKLQVDDTTNAFSPRKKVKNGDNGFVNPAFNPLNNRIVVERHSLETILESSLENVNESNVQENEDKNESFTDSTLEIHNKPKKKKNKSRGNSDDTYEREDSNSCENINNPNITDLSRYEVMLTSDEKKKLKNASENGDCADYNINRGLDGNLEMAIEQAAIEFKKKKKSIGVENPNFEDATPDESEQVTELKKKKKKKSKSGGIENPNFKDYVVNTSQDDPEAVQDGKSIKNKHKNLQNGIENPNFEDYLLNTSQDNPEVIYNEKSTKPKDLQVGIENAGFEDLVRTEPNGQFQKRKSKKRINGIQNPSFNDYSDTLNENGVCEEIQNTNTKSKKKKKKNASEEVNDMTSEETYLPESNVARKKVKLKKKSNGGIDNITFEEQDQSDNIVPRDNPYEVKVKHKKKQLKSDVHNDVKEENHISSDTIDYSDVMLNIVGTKKKTNGGIDNLIFEEKEDQSDNIVPKDNPYEVKVKRKKKQLKSDVHNDIKEESHISSDTIDYSDVMLNIVGTKKKSNGGVDNITFEEQDQSDNIVPKDNPYEVKVKHKKKQLKSDVQNDIKEESHISSDTIDYSDLMLNVVSTPVVSTPQREPEPKTLNTTKRRKSVRFNDVPQQHIIPNNEQLKLMEGIDNVNFDEVEVRLQENMEEISNTIDRVQAEIENDMNEKKSELEIMVGEMDRPDGPNEKLPDGTRLKFRHVEFDSKMPNYFAGTTGPKKSYKHLIKGDIILKFKNTNLHEINGYAMKKRRSV